MSADFLVEIGTEELPPTSLRSLMNAFADSLAALTDEERLRHGKVHAYASPRRLAVLIEKLADGQKDRKIAQKGPPINVAFDADGNPLAPAIAFAKKCGVEVGKLKRAKTEKGEWLSFETLESGKATSELMPTLVEKALAALPVPRRMRWGDNDAEFVRPVHWIVMLHGRDIVDASIMGIEAGRKSQGHRFHTKGAVPIAEPSRYLGTLEKKGHVIADFDARRKLIEKGVAKAAKEAGGSALGDDALYDEVTALVEWPVPVLGTFDEEFLALPREAVVSTLTSHQRYFPVADKAGNLLPRFVTVANLKSRKPTQVRAGNERVVRPRLADAAFFWNTDRKSALSSRRDGLRDVVYQRGLGSLFERSSRIVAISENLAQALGVPYEDVGRAAALSKCDLLTGMVSEFPELQGTMGRYYAELDGEPEAVATAIGEQYLPRFAGDALPQSIDGQILAIADKLDTLAGAFALGKKPSGNRDPFGLRRAALGIVRISVECALDFDLRALTVTANEAQPQSTDDSPRDEVYEYVTDRLRRYFLDRDNGLATETFDAVLARRPASLVDFGRRLEAVQAFIELDEAESLAAANKRIANILRQAGAEATGDVREKLLEDPAEEVLYAALGDASESVRPMLDERKYTEALTELSSLREPVDRFFDDVMVMADDESLKNNRLALLGQLRNLFLDVADISRLSIA